MTDRRTLFEDARGRDTRLTVVIEGRSVPVLGRRALIRNKRATGRAKDRLDVDALTRVEPESAP